MKRTITLASAVLVILSAGCRQDAKPPFEVELPVPDDSFLLGAAGAPQPLFGPASAPTFTEAFASLAADGFNRFVPVFLTDESGAGTDHFTYFVPQAAFPEEVFGPMPAELMCDGPSNAWLAAQGHLRIDLPAYLLLADQLTTAPVDPLLVRQRYEAFVSACLAGDTTQVGGLYMYDEPANAYMSSDCCDGDPASRFELGNVGVLADVGRDVVGAPVMIVEAPAPFFLPLVADAWGIPAGDIPSMVETFWTGVDATAPSADLYGFDVYPVDLITDFGPIVEYIGHGQTRSPSATPIVVLQGFGMDDMGIDLGTPGRRPSRAETRAMAFTAVAAGAGGIYWYGQSALVLEDTLWADVREVARDLRHLSGIWALPSVSMNVGSPAASVVAKRRSEVTFVLVTNTGASSIEVTIPVAPEATRVVDVMTQRSVAENPADELVLDLSGYETRVLALME